MLLSVMRMHTVCSETDRLTPHPTLTPCSNPKHWTVTHTDPLYAGPP